MADFFYEKIYQAIKRQIQRGNYRPGMQLPTETELCEIYDVSRITARRALRMLSDEGLIERQRSRGSFIADGEPLRRLLSEEGNQHKKRSGVRRRIGLIMEDLSECYGLSLYYQLERHSRAEGYELYLKLSYGMQEREYVLIDELMALGIDALIIMPAHGRHYNVKLLRLVLDAFPVLLLDRSLSGIPAPCVQSAHLPAARALTRLLLESGCHQPCFISEPPQLATSLLARKQGYEMEMREHGLESRALVLDTPVQYGDPYESDTHFPQTCAEIKTFLQRETGVDAIIAGEWGLASISRRVIEQIRKDDNLPIACFDQIYREDGSYPFIHFRQDTDELAEKAIEAVRQLIQGDAASDHNIPMILFDKVGVGDRNGVGDRSGAGDANTEV